MKRSLSLILAVMVLLCACTAVKEQEPAIYEGSEELLMEEVDLAPRITVSPVLYFLNDTQTALATETREISVPQNSLYEQYVVQALIDGPVSDTLYPVVNGFQLDRIEVMPDVTNVYLTQGGYKDQDAVLNAKLAVAATLNDFSGNRYTNVLVNGMQTAYAGEPTGSLQKTETNLSEERKVLESKAQTDSPDMYATLYYLNSTEEFLLPETRRLRFQNKDYISVLVEQLIRGPEDTYNHKAVMDSSTKLLWSEIVDAGDGAKTARLHFSREPRVSTSSFVDGNRIALASITYTIMDFIPDLSGVEVFVNDTKAHEGVYRPDDFEELIGSNILLYLPTGSSSMLETGVNRVIQQSEAYLPGVVLGELMKGPTEAEDRSKYPAVPDVYPAMPDGVTFEDVKRVYIAGDIMVIDFDASVHEKMRGISRENEFMMVFSIVNTMTSVEGIRRVQFLVDGERVERLGDGIINVIDPIIKNPGMIR